MQQAGTSNAKPGALVVSLDFELAWGMLGAVDVEGPYRARLLGAREAVPRILERFARHDVAATWATVGMLFAESKEELLAHAPAVRPAYAAPLVDPYAQPMGASERADPTRFAPSLLRLIADHPRQEVGSHSFAHFTGLEPGHEHAAFQADLAAAGSIARARGIALRSYVWPRHQLRADWLADLAHAGYVAHRGPPAHPWYAAAAGRQGGPAVRAGRLLDAYLPLTGPLTHPWSALAPAPAAPGAPPLANVPESRFLRAAEPRARALEPLRADRVVRAMRQAARRGEVVHVWWHPHNFGADLDLNLAALDAVLRAYDALRDRYGMRSLTMAAAAAAAAEAAAPAAPTPR